MEWIDTEESAPDKPGYYWGVFVVLRPVVAVTRWTGWAWLNSFDDGPPFYWGSQRLPDAPDTQAIFAEVMERVARYIEEEE